MGKRGYYNMKNLMKYQDYYGTVEYSAEDNILYGKVIGVDGLISYETN